MRNLLIAVMTSNSLLFLLGAVQHFGVPIGSLREPYILPAAIVETICGLCLAWGAAAIVARRNSLWPTVVIANLVALNGVLLGIAALAVGGGPRTASNDLYHRIMLVLVGVSFAILFSKRRLFRQI